MLILMTPIKYLLASLLAESSGNFSLLLPRSSGLDPRKRPTFLVVYPPAMAALLELFLGSSSAPVDWEAEAYPAYGDFAVLPLLVAFFPAVRFLLDRLVFEVRLNQIIK
jgi:hypothetical protein